MRYAQIRKMDITNGTGIGVSLFTQGCPYRCKGCFNPETWDFNGGKEWNKNVEDYFLSLLNNDFVQRITFLGGEPLIENNLEDLKKLLIKIKEFHPNIEIWCYSGNTFENMSEEQLDVLKYVDVLVDGPFIFTLKDLTLKYRGSSNQRIIDVQQTLTQNKIVLKEC